jgi:hypothetical protein
MSSILESISLILSQNRRTQNSPIFVAYSVQIARTCVAKFCVFQSLNQYIRIYQVGREFLKFPQYPFQSLGLHRLYLYSE